MASAYITYITTATDDNDQTITYITCISFITNKKEEEESLTNDQSKDEEVQAITTDKPSTTTSCDYGNLHCRKLERHDEGRVKRKSQNR